MEYLNFKNLKRKRKYSELEEEYENQFSKKGRRNDDLEVENDFMVKSVFLTVAALIKNTKKKPHPKQK